MQKVKLIAPWRGYQPGDIVDVTPGQRTTVLTLQKGHDYVPKEPEAKKPAGKKAEAKTEGPKEYYERD